MEKLIYGGDGLARLPADEQGRRKAVFIPFTLPGETVSVAVEQEKPGFARAAIAKILAPSPERIVPRCGYFQQCGGCHYQHTGYGFQLQSKAAILRENLQRLGKLPLASEIPVHSASPWSYRNRVRLQVRAQSWSFALGYRKRSSHELLPVESCPISSPLINRAIETVWRLGRAGQVPEQLREIELFANHDDSQLMVEFYSDPRGSAPERERAGKSFAARLREELPEVTSVDGLASATVRGSPAAAGVTVEWRLGSEQFSYQTAAGRLRVSGGSFFQVNRFLIDELVALVCGGRSGKTALDLYAGVGLFSAALGASFDHIEAVESSQSSVNDLQYNCPPNGKARRATVEEYLASRAERFRPEFVVVDPPRAGLGERVARSLGTLAAARLTYVSCDPATLARDLAVLTAAGYRLEKLHLVDLFPQTYHIETVAHLVR